MRLTWRVRLLTRLDAELKSRLRETAETESIKVFAANLHDLLLAAPAGPRITLGLDPGLRTGVKVAVVDATGKVVATDTIYPHPPRKDWDPSIATLANLARKYQVTLVAIGNGTASRETDRLAAELIKRHPALKLNKVMVSEAGASVYSASALASSELPELDVSLRGAVSIARRLQDPGRAGQDRPQGNRRRAIPARRQPVPARTIARQRGGRLRERRRCGRQHRLTGTAVARRRPVRHGRREHRSVP